MSKLAYQIDDPLTIADQSWGGYTKNRGGRVLCGFIETYGRCETYGLFGNLVDVVANLVGGY